MEKNNGRNKKENKNQNKKKIKMKQVKNIKFKKKVFHPKLKIMKNIKKMWVFKI
jgi:hypothetical protein